MRTQTTSTTGPSRAASESPRVVSRDEWLAERKALLAQEKELTHLRDRIAGERRALPWVRIDKDYVFDAPEGRRSLAVLLERLAERSVGRECVRTCRSGCPPFTYTQNNRTHSKHNKLI